MSGETIVVITLNNGLSQAFNLGDVGFLRKLPKILYWRELLKIRRSFLNSVFGWVVKQDISYHPVNATLGVYQGPQFHSSSRLGKAVVEGAFTVDTGALFTSFPQSFAHQALKSLGEIFLNSTVLSDLPAGRSYYVDLYYIKTSRLSLESIYSDAGRIVDFAGTTLVSSFTSSGGYERDFTGLGLFLQKYVSGLILELPLWVSGIDIKIYLGKGEAREEVASRVFKTSVSSSVRQSLYTKIMGFIYDSIATREGVSNGFRFARASDEIKHIVE